MSMSSSMPSRPTLLTTSALAGMTPDAPPPAVSADTGAANPQSRDATTLAFYVLLAFIMLSLILGVFPQF